MNLLEFRLLAYKRRNWSYTFIRVQNDRWKKSDDLLVEVKTKEQVVQVVSANDTVLQSAINGVLGVVTYVPMQINLDTDLHTHFVSGLSAPETEYFGGDTKSKATSKMSAALVGLVINPIYANKLKTTLKTSSTANMLVQERVPMYTSISNIIAYTSGALMKATIAKLSEYSDYTLQEITDRYNAIFRGELPIEEDPKGDTLKNMAYYMLD